MKDVKEIRQKLWDSFDMQAVVRWFFAGLFLAVFTCLLVWLRPTHLPKEARGTILAIMLLMTAAPFFVFCIWRTIRIFQHPESYTFCKARLSQPIRGWARGTIRFTVVVEDSRGNKFAANTHSVFSVSGSVWPSLENYINKTVTIAYNEETGMEVVIG